VIKYQQGSYREAIELLSQGAASRAIDPHVTEPHQYDEGEAPAASVYAANALVWAPGIAAFCYAELGEFQKAFECGKVAQRNAAARGLSFERGYVEFTLGAVHLLKGELDLALPMLEQCREIGSTTNASALLVWVAPALALLYDLLGRTADGIALLKEAKDIERSGGYVQYGPVTETSLGHTYALLDRRAQGVATIESAIKLAHAHERRGEEAWALFRAGDVHMMLSPPDLILARKYYTQAIALARELAMRPLTAFCHLGLGRLAQIAGDSEEGREQGGSAGLMLREMDMQFWLEEAESFRRSIER
jgi:tetratricopeptide (TPR) repeat protein